jgi:excisionase family DNA binding protein
MKPLSTKDAAERLGISQRRVNALIQSGRLPAVLFGGSWMIQEEDLRLVSDRKPGRPLLDEKSQAAKVIKRELKKTIKG